MDKHPQVISFSGGKDSTAMVHWLLDQGEKIASVLIFDTGWEFPEMHEHWQLFEQKTGLHPYILRPRLSFDDWLTRLPIHAAKDHPKEGVKKGDIRRYGYGWPSLKRRWCTEMKIRVLDSFARRHWPGSVQCIGYAFDEKKRAEKHQKSKRAQGGRLFRYPLVEAEMTEQEALDYCLKLGYHWNGLYEHKKRVSCFCCPLQSLGGLRYLYEKRPELWEHMLATEDNCLSVNRGFHGYDTVHDLDERFRKEDAARQ